MAPLPCQLCGDTRARRCKCSPGQADALAGKHLTMRLRRRNVIQTASMYEAFSVAATRMLWRRVLLERSCELAAPKMHSAQPERTILRYIS